jgi:multiple sugar transport system substrate-binding protein
MNVRPLTSRGPAKTRRWVFQSAVIAASASGATACAGGAGGGGAPEPAAVSPTLRVTDLTVTQNDVPPDTRMRHDTVAAAFEARYGGRLRYTVDLPPFAEYPDKVTTLIAADTPPDVFNMWAQYRPSWVGKDLVLDLTSRIKASKEAATSHYLAPMVDAMTLQGKLWGTAQDFNGQMIFVNLDLLERRGVAAPNESWTMEQYRDLAKRLTAPDRQEFGSTNFINVVGQQQFAFLWNYGKHHWVSPDGTKSLVGSATSVQAHQLFADMQFQERSIPWRDNPLAAGTSAATGHVAFSVVWGNYPYQLYDTWTKLGVAPFKWKMLPFPKGPQDQRDHSQGHLWSIAKNNKRPDAAWAVAEFLGGIEGWKVWAQTHGQPLAVNSPELWKVYLDFLPPDKAAEVSAFYLDRLYKGLAVNFAYWPTFGDCSPVMADALRAIFTDNANVKSTLETAQQKMDGVLAKR